MRRAWAFVIGALAVVETGACEKYHHIWTKDAVRYFTVPGHDNPSAGATYTTDVPDAQCTSKQSQEQTVCVDKATCGVIACTTGSEVRHFQISVGRDKVSVRVDGGTCPLPLAAMRAEIDATIKDAGCREDARRAIAALVRRHLPRSYDEALRDEQGLVALPIGEENAGRYVELLPGVRLRWERDTFLDPKQEASGDSTYVTLSRGSDGHLIFDALLSRLSLSIVASQSNGAPDRALRVASIVDLNGRDGHTSWYLIYPEAVASAQVQPHSVVDLPLMIGGDDRARLERIVASTNRSDCLRELCKTGPGVADPNTKCNDPEANRIACVVFPLRSVLVPELHVMVNGGLRHCPLGSTLGGLLTEAIGERAAALSHSVIHLDRWYNGKFVRFELPMDWAAIPVLSGDRVSW